MCVQKSFDFTAYTQSLSIATFTRLNFNAHVLIIINNKTFPPPKLFKLLLFTQNVPSKIPNLTSFSANADSTIPKTPHQNHHKPPKTQPNILQKPTKTLQKHCKALQNIPKCTKNYQKPNHNAPKIIKMRPKNTQNPPKISNEKLHGAIISHRF